MIGTGKSTRKKLIFRPLYLSFLLIYFSKMDQTQKTRRKTFLRRSFEEVIDQDSHSIIFFQIYLEKEDNRYATFKDLVSKFECRKKIIQRKDDKCTIKDLISKSKHKGKNNQCTIKDLILKFEHHKETIEKEKNSTWNRFSLIRKYKAWILSKKLLKLMKPFHRIYQQRRNESKDENGAMLL